MPEPTPLQLDVCDWLQDGPSKSITMGFRGMGKSYLTAAYAAWSLAMDPQELIMVISAGKERADLFTKFTRRIIQEIEIFHPLIPNTLRGDMDSNVSFQVGCSIPQQSPSVTSKGIGGQLTGSRASLVILDDVEVPNNSATPMLREKLVTALEEVSAILLPATERIKPRVRVLGTPQTELSIYTTLERKGYITRIWPIETPDEARKISYGDRLAPFVGRIPGVGMPVEPSRFGPVEIASRRLEYGKGGYALQFLLDTSLSDAERYPLKLKDLIVDSFDYTGAREVYVHSNHPRARLVQFENIGLEGDGFFGPGDVYGDTVKFEATILAVDPSGRGADETGLAAVSGHSGLVFVHSCYGLVGGYDEKTLEAIAREAKRVRASKIVVESNFGDGMFSRLLAPVLHRIYPCTIEEVRSVKMKEGRILETLEPVLATNRMVVHPRVIESDMTNRPDETAERQRARRLFYQMTRLANEKGCLMHDDRLDALALAVGSLADSLSRSAQHEARMRDGDDDYDEQPLPSWISQSAEVSPLFRSIR